MSRILAPLLICLVVPAALLPGEATFAQQQDRCCYSNPRFSGVCAVQPGPDETCASILAYLNNPMSSGKNYCGNTEIRGGWKQVKCPAKHSPGTAQAGVDGSQRPAATDENPPRGRNGGAETSCSRLSRYWRPGE